jgi:hypothetical protein
VTPAIQNLAVAVATLQIKTTGYSVTGIAADVK